MGKLSNYIKESIIEIKKVTWPTKKETYRYSFLVIAISLLVAIVLGGFDYIFNLGLKSLIIK